MDKLKRFLYEQKIPISVFTILAGITILLCVPFTLGYAVKVFGWAVWFYLAVAYLIEGLHCAKKQVNLTLKSAVFLILAVFCSLSTLHIAFMKRETLASFTDYIVGSYQNGTVGGAVLGIVTSPIAVGFTYVWAIVFFMVCAAVLFFFFFRPFIFEGTKSPIIEGKKKKKATVKPVCREILLDEAPFMQKKTFERREPVAFMVADENAAKKEKSARELLFGGEREISSSVTHFGNEDLYDVKKYSFDRNKEENVSNDEATEILLGKEERYIEPTLNYGEDEDEEEVIFDDEKDESISDLLRPHSFSDSFFQALTMEAGERHAPTPIDYSYDVEDRDEEPEEENDGPGEDNEVQQETTVNPTGVPVSSDYVYINGMLVPVLKNSGIPYAQAQAEETADMPYVPPVAPAQPTQTMRPAVSNPPRFVPFPAEGQKEPLQAGEHKFVQLVMTNKEVPYKRPPLSLLKTYVTENFSQNVENWDELKDIFEVRLKNFGVDAELVDAHKGPTVTLCLLKLGDRCPISKLNAIKTDLQRWLKSNKPIAIISQIEGTDYCGVQIPNEVKATVSFKDIISSKEYREAKGDIIVALGQTAEGKVLVDDLAAMPHALVAGETGSGKSVCLNVILSSIIFRYSPDEVKLLLIDLKQVEMAPYSGLPHMLLKEPLSSIPEIVNVLKWIREEVVGRFTLFKTLHIRNLTEYNNREGVEKLSRIVIVIDEASELMSDANARKTLESTLNSLARIARAAGVHLLFATQNPVKTVITSEIQNNLPTKIAFAVSDYVHSQVIFKSKGAECLLGRGDMYIKKGQDMTRAQCAFISTDEIEAAAEYIRENNEYGFNEAEIEKIINGAATQSEEVKNAQTVASSSGRVAPFRTAGAPSTQEEGETGDADEPDLMWQALKYCVDAQYVSCSYLQRKLKKGYNTVANILEELAKEGYVSAVPQGSKEKREILISKEDFYREWESRYGADEDHELENFDSDEDI